MLANIRIGQEEFGEALASLHAIPAGTREGAYATYNMGVAMIRANHIDDGVRMLSGVLNLPRRRGKQCPQGPGSSGNRPDTAEARSGRAGPRGADSGSR